MATGSGHMAPGWLVWLQCPATWHQGGWDGNGGRPHGTSEAWMATGSGHMVPVRLVCQQGLMYSYSARPHDTMVAGMATGSGRKALGRLGWQQDIATCHQEG